MQMDLRRTNHNVNIPIADRVYITIRMHEQSSNSRFRNPTADVIDDSKIFLLSPDYASMVNLLTIGTARSIAASHGATVCSQSGMYTTTHCPIPHLDS